jgi:hypothetical protein
VAKILRPLGIALAILILLSSNVDATIFGHPALAASEKPDRHCQISLADPQDGGDQQAGLNGADLEQEFPVMKPSRETRQKWIERYNKAPKATVNAQIKARLAQAPGGGSLSLLNYLQYTPSQRNQGSCGNCWAWAGTGVMEIALDFQKGIKDRLSIQYLNSNYNGGSGPDWACCGGDLDDMANFYAGKGKTIPWSNTNANYQDGGRACGSSTSVPAASIGTSFYYPISTIATQTITTQGIDQATAIANIENVLNQNKAVWFAFWLPTTADWNNFRTFWNTQAETAIWNPDFSCGHTWDAGGGGHAVLCVGYNDSDADPANHYWLMLNSWGTTSSRPNGLFRLAMNMNYSCTYLDVTPCYSFYWQTLNMTYGNPVTLQKVIGADDITATENNAGGYLFLDKWTAAASGNVQTIKIKCGASGNVKVAMYADNGGSPGALLNAVNTSTAVVSGWNEIPFPSTAVTQGTVYWLASISNAFCIGYKSQSGSVQKYKPATFSTFTFPNPADTDFWDYAGYNIMAGWSTPAAPTTPTVTNSTGAGSVTLTSARLNGEVTSNGNADTTVHIYWGPSDGGTTPGSWANDVNLGVKSVGTFYTDISSLTPSTTYYYRCYATNSAGSAWAASTASFTTSASPTAPTVTNSTGASNISDTGARLNGEVTSTGNASTSVTIYWGPADGGTTQGSWANSVPLGAKPAGTFYTDISSLTASTTYYYRCYATNSVGSAWAASTASFTTNAHSTTSKLIGADDITATGNNAGAHLFLDKWTAAASGNVQTIKIKCGASGNVKVALYADYGGSPGALLNAVNTSTAVSSGFSNEISFPSTAVTQGTTYWLASISDASCIGYKSQSGSIQKYKPATFSTFTFPSSADTDFDDYAGYNIMAGWSAPSVPPPVPALLSPGTAITFKWGTATGATKYHLQVNTDSSFPSGPSMVFENDNIATTAQEVTGLSLSTTYYWRARAGNNGGWSDWSAKRSVLASSVP